MKDSRSHLSLRYRTINALGRLLMVAGMSSLQLDEKNLSAAAMEKTGLDDFGDPHYHQGLLRLLESAEKDANLHPIGRYTTKDIVTNYLAQRLKMVETRKREPEIFQKPLLPPLIIVGPARSGTSFLHQMLAIDPAYHALPQWLLVRPFPERDWNGEGPDPRIEIMEEALRMRQPLLPGFDSIHYTRADTPEECILALGLTFNSLIFYTLLPVYDYMEWFLQHTGAPQKFREYRWLLQVFQTYKPERRLVLKAPAHTGNLEPLTQAVPEALLIQTHRDLVACISSVCSLLYTFHLAVASQLDLRRMSSLTLQGYEVLARRNLEFRAAHPGVVYDVFYDDLVSDPFGTVRGIYSHFGLPWSEAYATNLEKFIRNNKKDKHGAHRYSASDFGLTEAEIAERMRFFSDHFGLG